MMKKITRSISGFFIYNAIGWGLVFANFAVISFLLWFSSGVIHTQMPSDGAVQKVNIISSYKMNGGDILNGLSDLTMLVVIAVNFPALYLSNLVYETFLAGKAENISTVNEGCKFCWFYISQISCDIFFMTLQWLAVGLIIRRLCKLVKDS